MTSTAKRDNVRLVSVIMKADSSANRNAMTKTLLDYGFSKIKGSILYNKDSQVATININKAKEENIKLYCKDDIILVYENSLKNENIVKEIRLIDNLSLPIKANEYVADLIVKYEDEQYSYKLYVKQDVLMLKMSELVIEYIKEILF